MFAQRLTVAVAALVLLSIAACSPASGPTLTAPEAYAQAQAGKLTLIDIRHPDEWYQTGVAKGALRIDMTNEQNEAGFVRQVGSKVGNNKGAPIGLISLAGNRAARAQKILLDAGFIHVYNIKEGMAGSGAGPGWVAHGLPVVACPDC